MKRTAQRNKERLGAGTFIRLGELREEVVRLADTERRSLSGMARLLIEEAISFRKARPLAAQRGAA